MGQWSPPVPSCISLCGGCLSHLVASQVAPYSLHIALLLTRALVKVTALNREYGAIWDTTLQSKLMGPCSIKAAHLCRLERQKCHPLLPMEPCQPCVMLCHTTLAALLQGLKEPLILLSIVNLTSCYSWNVSVFILVIEAGRDALVLLLKSEWWWLGCVIRFAIYFFVHYGLELFL